VTAAYTPYTLIPAMYCYISCLYLTYVRRITLPLPTSAAAASPARLTLGPASTMC
jgi:hypothetical protein